MTRTWKMLGLSMFLAAAVLAGPSTTARADEAAPDLKDIARRIKNIESAMVEIQRNADAILKEGLKYQALVGRISELEEKMGKMQTQLDALKKEGAPKERTSAYPPESIEEIQKRLAQIEDVLKRMGPAPRVSRFPPNNAGRIVLTNQYPEEMLFIINGRENFRLAPGTSRVLEGFPAGTFTYEVVSPSWGSRARKTTSLAANETYRITVD
jgi:outer membrane murein-binding lipoprotein Lpp